MELVGAGRAKAAAGWLAGLALPRRTRCWKESARAATANSSLKPNSLLAGSLQGISGILAQMGPSGIRAQMGPKLRSGTFNKGSIGLVAMSVLGTPVDLEKD